MKFFSDFNILACYCTLRTQNPVGTECFCQTLIFILGYEEQLDFIMGLLYC